MEEANMALGLFNEAKSFNQRNDDWERDFMRLQQQSDRYDRQRAIKANFIQIVSSCARPTTALKGAHA